MNAFLMLFPLRISDFLVVNKSFIWNGTYGFFKLIDMTEPEVQEVGTIVHFFSKIGVAIVELKKPLKVGDQILVKGPSTDFEMTVVSMQVEHKSIENAEAGQSIGLKTTQPAKERDVVYKKILWIDYNQAKEDLKKPR